MNTEIVDQRERARKELGNRLAPAIKASVESARNRHVTFNRERWEGLLDFIELDLYNKMTDGLTDSPEDRKYKKELFVKFEGFSRARAHGVFDRENVQQATFALAVAMRGMYDRALDYFEVAEQTIIDEHLAQESFANPEE